jgi:chemotaxis protein MotA
VNWSQIARKEGLLGLETLAEQETDPFAGKGLQLLVDGTEAEAIRNILEVDLNTREQFDLQGAKVFESMGIYAPTLGIIGAVMGLMAVMQNLADPSRSDPVSPRPSWPPSTESGLPTCSSCRWATSSRTIQSQTAYREMIIDGITSIAEGENPRNIETKLAGYVL